MLDISKLPYLKQPHPLLKPVAIIFSLLVISIFSFILATGSATTDPQDQLPQQNSIQTVPTPYQDNDLQEASCSNLQPEEIQSCCAQWANANQISTPLCVGTWITNSASSCSWKCTSTPELTVEEDQTIPSIGNQ